MKKSPWRYIKCHSSLYVQTGEGATEEGGSRDEDSVPRLQARPGCAAGHSGPLVHYFGPYNTPCGDS